LFYSPEDGREGDREVTAMVHPFDLRAALLAKHAQHVALVHFPIALFMVGVLFDSCAAWTRREVFSSAAFLNFSAAALAAPFTLVTGLLAWQWQLEGEKLKGILLYHLLAALASTAVILATWLLHYRTRKNVNRSFSVWRFPFEFLGVGIVGLTGHLGGFLSGVNF
jgi:uncharacterized membrane protein